MANIELDGANRTIKVDSSNLTLDIPGDIILDADGANVTFKDGGTSVLDLSNSSTDAVLTVSTQDKDLIMIGRDIGTVVLPKAKYKFFLDSNIETRTKRRMDQKKININDQAEIDKNFDSIKNRDLIDKSRDLSPLKPAQDAIIIYNDHIDLNATVDLMKNIILD